MINLEDLPDKWAVFRNGDELVYIMVSSMTMNNPMIDVSEVGEFTTRYIPRGDPEIHLDGRIMTLQADPPSGPAGTVEEPVQTEEGVTVIFDD